MNLAARLSTPRTSSAVRGRHLGRGCARAQGGSVMKLRLLALAFSLVTPALSAQTAPPGPVLVAPASGASLVQPITLRWNPIVDPRGPIGSYTWEISTSSTFGSVISSGFNNLSSPEIPAATDAQVSGLANGTYF